jgi:hypothetical protein
MTTPKTVTDAELRAAVERCRSAGFRVWLLALASDPNAGAVPGWPADPPTDPASVVDAAGASACPD